MTLDSLKKQAARLAAYMGAKHRINLKLSRALEAIAAAHGARNWQTLAALTRQSTTERAPGPTPCANRGPLPLTLYPDGRAHIQFPQSEWARHAIAFGDADSVQGWARDQAATALSAGYSMVLVEFDSAAAKHYSPEVVVLDLSQTQQRASGSVAGEFGINILKGLTDTMVSELSKIVTPGQPGELFARLGLESTNWRDSEALGLKELIELAVPVVVILPERGGGAWGEFLLCLFEYALRGNTAAWVLALPKVEPFHGPGLSRIAEQGRGMGCFLRAGVLSPGLRVADQASVSRLTKNAYHHVDLRSAKQRMPDMLEHLTRSPASCISGGQYMF